MPSDIVRKTVSISILRSKSRSGANIAPAMLAFICCLTFITSAPAHAQQPDSLWSYTYGDNWDASVFVGETSDGDFLMVGRLDMAYTGGMMVARISAEGDEEWVVTRDDVIPFSGAITAEGGLVASGYSNTSPRRAVMVAYDGNGQFQWMQTYGTGDNAYGRPVDQVPDGGFVLYGLNQTGGLSYAMLWRTDSTGDQLWVHNYGSDEWPYDCLALADSCCLLVNQGTYQMMKVDPTGEPIWVHHYASTFSGVAVVDCADRGYAMASCGIGFMDLLKVDALGNLQWQSAYGYPDGYCIPSSVDQTWDGGYILAGSLQGLSPYPQLIMVRTDPAGAQLWQMVVPCTVGTEILVHACETSDGGYIVSGMECCRVIRYAPGLGVEDGEGDSGMLTLDAPFPNPFASEVCLPYSMREAGMVRAGVYDLSGSLVAVLGDAWQQAGQHSLAWDGTGYEGERCPVGTYLIRIESNGVSACEKVILLN